MDGKINRVGLGKSLREILGSEKVTIKFLYEPDLGASLIEPLDTNKFKLINPTDEILSWIDNQESILTDSSTYMNIKTVEFLDLTDVLRFKLMFGEPKNTKRPTASSIQWFRV